MIKFLADECIYLKIVDLLKAHGYDIISIKDLGLKGSSDTLVFTKAQELNRILLTADQDFGNIINYPLSGHHGIIILKLSKKDEEKTYNNLLKMLSIIKLVPLNNSLIIVDNNKYRIRKS